MPSFDIVAEVDWQEVKNAVNQTNREIGARFDFKGSDARVDAGDPLLTVRADDDFKVGQVVEVLSEEAVELIHDGSMRILEQIGLEIVSDEARALMLRHGAEAALEAPRARMTAAPRC